MEGQDKRERKIIQLATHNSFARTGQREAQTLSTSRSKKYLPISQRTKGLRHEQLNNFMKRSNREAQVRDNDYGLTILPKEKELDSEKMTHNKNNKIMMKNDQPHNRTKKKLFKQNSQKKYQKLSQKANSLQILTRMNQVTSPMKKSFTKTVQKTTQPHTSIQEYQKTIDFLQKQNEYYTGMYLNTQNQLEILRKETEDQKKKYDRVRRIYQQKIQQMSQNKQICQKNLGHIYSYDHNNQYDLVPEQVILEKSIQFSIDEVRGSRKISELSTCKMSTLSLNSIQDQ